MPKTKNQIDLTSTVEAITQAAEAIASAAEALPYNQQLEAAIIRAKAARKAADDADAHLAACRQDVLDLMVKSDLGEFNSPFGTVKVCKGRRTISVIDKKLSAEIIVLKERGLKTGRSVVKIGADYVTIK